MVPFKNTSIFPWFCLGWSGTVWLCFDPQVRGERVVRGADPGGLQEQGDVRKRLALLLRSEPGGPARPGLQRHPDSENTHTHTHTHTKHAWFE